MKIIKLVFCLSILRSFILLGCIIFFQTLNSQEIFGKWIQLKNCEALSYPSINIFEFTDSNLIQYDFDKKLDSANYVIQENSINLGKTLKTIKFLDENFLELIGPATYNGRDTLMSNKYLRIGPTESELSPEFLIDKKFILNWNNALNLIEFKDSKSKNPFQLSRFRVCNDVRLEELDQMLFLSIFCSNKREFVFPIKAVTTDKLTFYNDKYEEFHAELID